MEAPAEGLTASERDASDLDGAIAAARAGDPRALAILYQAFAGPLLAVAYRLLLSRADAEDVVHDLFVGLPEALRRYEERGAFEPWLKRIAVRLALSRLRAPARRESGLEAASTVPAAAHHPVDRVAIADAMSRLSPSLRAVVVLKEVEGFSHGEIAAMLGISVGASEVRLHRALGVLRTLLSEDP